MRKATKGIRYDPAKAVLVASADHRDAPPQSAWTASLYRSERVQRPFLWGQGGIMTIFRGGEDIIPLTEDQAKQWLEATNPKGDAQC